MSILEINFTLNTLNILKLKLLTDFVHSFFDDFGTTALILSSSFPRKVPITLS